MLSYEKSRSGKWHSGLNGKKWRDSEIYYLMKYGNDKPPKELSAILSRSIASVILMRRRLGLNKLTNHKVWSEHDLRTLKSLAGKMIAKDIAKILDRSLSSIRQKAFAVGIPLVCIGENNPHSIHSDDDVILCRQLRDEGMSVKLIAEKMEMPLGAVKWVIYGSRKTQLDRVTLELDRMDARR